MKDGPYRKRMEGLAWPWSPVLSFGLVIRMRCEHVSCPSTTLPIRNGRWNVIIDCIDGFSCREAWRGPRRSLVFKVCLVFLPSPIR